jgi:hypothetical protein
MWMIRKEFRRNHPGVYLERWRNSAVGTGGVLDEIRREHVPNINVDRYRCANLLDGCSSQPPTHL